MQYPIPVHMYIIHVYKYIYLCLVHMLYKQKGKVNIPLLRQSR